MYMHDLSSLSRDLTGPYLTLTLWSTVSLTIDLCARLTSALVYRGEVYGLTFPNLKVDMYVYHLARLGKASAN